LFLHTAQQSPPQTLPVCRLHPIPAGHYVIIVSSGAVGVGCQRLGLAQRPTKLAQKQALAAIGQVHLMRYYEDILNALGLVRRLDAMPPFACSIRSDTLRIIHV
jgi:hypothetical protein